MKRCIRVAVMLLAMIAALPATSAGLTARDVTGELFRASEGQPPDFSGRDLTRLDLSGLNFKKARLVKAELFGADLSGADLSGGDLTGAHLDRVTLMATRFDNADLSGASLLRPSVFSSMAQSAAEAPSFKGAVMRRIRIFGRFTRSDFSGADLTDATCAPFGKTGFIENIWRTELLGVNLPGANLTRADLSQALLRFANLRSANLRDVILKGADLSGADLTEADVTGADVSGADLDGANFKNAKGVDTLIGLSVAKNAGKILK